MFLTLSLQTLGSVDVVSVLVGLLEAAVGLVLYSGSVA